MRTGQMQSPVAEGRKAKAVVLYGETLSAENELDHLSHRYNERPGKACVRQDPEGAEYNLISH